MVGTARGGVRSLWLATSRGSDRGCGSEGGRPDAPDCTTPPFSPRPFPTHGPFRAQTTTNLTLISQTSTHVTFSPLTGVSSPPTQASSLLAGRAHTYSQFSPLCGVHHNRAQCLPNSQQCQSAIAAQRARKPGQTADRESGHGGERTLGGWWKEEEGEGGGGSG